MNTTKTNYASLQWIVHKKSNDKYRIIVGIWLGGKWLAGMTGGGKMAWLENDIEKLFEYWGALQMNYIVYQ